jgi:hypothetical protein
MRGQKPKFIGNLDQIHRPLAIEQLGELWSGTSAAGTDQDAAGIAPGRTVDLDGGAHVGVAEALAQRVDRLRKGVEQPAAVVVVAGEVEQYGPGWPGGWRDVNGLADRLGPLSADRHSVTARRS